MKYSSLLLFSGLFISSVAWGTESENWSAQSIEKQFDNISEAIVKTSKSKQTDVHSLTANPQSKTAKIAQNRKEEHARILTERRDFMSVTQEFWIFDAWVEFHRDDDRDGYFNYFSVEFDADTEYSSAEVYARLYLGKDEVFKEYHTTSTFNIFSDSSNDSFVVESELLNGFSPAEYEVLIELYDAYSNELVAVFDGNNDADLYLLSLESTEYESVQVIVVREHGGSVSLWGMLLLSLIFVTRLFKKV